VRPWAEFERVWQTTEPTASAPGLHVVGLNSARPFRHQGGALSGTQLERATARLAAAEEGALRVAVLHHHLIGAPWRAAHKRPVSRRNHVLRKLVDGGADLILAGHIHQAAVSERHEFEVVGDESRTAVVAIAPGLGQPRPQRLGEARGLHLHEADADAIVVRTFRWSGGDWTLSAERRFLR
jgi:3',5'-cyclic AMP phosphodiesterase CpdA